MKIRELIEIEKYINKLIEDYSWTVRNEEQRMNLTGDDHIRITIDEGRRIAKCLDWLQQMVSQRIDDVSVETFTIDSKSLLD